MLIFVRFCVLTTLSVCLLGCGGSMGRVEGTVTLDGTAVKGAYVQFQPEDGSRPSVSFTDDAGRYELLHTADVKGAVVGKHRVSITTRSEGEDPATGKNVVVKEKIPAKYNLKSELVKEVTSGSNVIDFQLDSKGEIIDSGTAPKRPPASGTGCDGGGEDGDEYVEEESTEGSR
jgi:hypothetical protein